MKQVKKEDVVKNLENNDTFVIKFEADWCGPCRMLTEVFKGVSGELEQTFPSIQTFKFDIDSDVEYAKSFGIRGVPVLIAFKDGKEVARKVGLISDKQILDFYSTI
jgi:thioredoxin 1